MTTIKDQLLEKLQKKQAGIAVLGMGYVGLPLAVVFAEAGFHVTGIDPEAWKVEQLQAGRSYIPDIPSERLAPLVAGGLLRATTDFAVLRGMDAVSICVPTPLKKTGDPDMSFILSATEKLSACMHPGMVVVLESTTYPGTTREVLLPRLGEANRLTAGVDWFLAFSPERVDPGRQDYTTLNTPKVMGGVTPACGQVAAAWYRSALQQVYLVSSAETAEMAKLLENTFRMVNIAMVNELAIMCQRMGVDVWEVIEAAATKPFGFMKFTPGPGLGGHCIPIDPLYLSWKMKAYQYTAHFIELAADINTNMPRYVVTRILEAMNARGKTLKGARLLVLGSAYKPDVDDLRESPALDVIGLLEQRGAEVAYHDPYIPVLQTHGGREMHSVPDLMQAVRQADAVVIVTNHSAYDYAGILQAAAFIFDSRNALGALGRDNPKVERL